MDELSGALVERVGIEAWVDLRDEARASAGYWAARGEVFAAVSPAGGTGSGAGNSVVGSVDGEARRTLRRWQVVLRAPVAVDLTSRLRWRGDTLAVLSVAKDPRTPDRVTLACETRTW